MSTNDTTEGRSSTEAIRMALLTLGLTTWSAPARYSLSIVSSS